MYPNQGQPQAYPPQPGFVQPGFSGGSINPGHGSAGPMNPNMPLAPAPTAPPASLFDSVAGYEQTAYGQGYLPPPPVVQAMPEQQRPDEHFVAAASITAEEAKDSLQDFVAANCCYGSSPAKEMTIHDIKPSSAYHYKLSTFTESRSTSWQVEPYTGQIVDGPHNGPAPGPWNVMVQPSKTFSEGDTRVEVPHTASVKQCHTCYGGGFHQCKTCLGRGWSKCTPCQGRGYNKNEFNEDKQCESCRGAGEGRCPPCNGEGRVKCTTCQGHTKLKTFIQLTVSWKNHVKDHVVERSQGGPKDKVAGASGIDIFKQELPRVWPITTFFDKDINMASQAIVTEHGNAWPKERILMQRQILRAVPVAEVSYGWKQDEYRFWVYGSSPRKVFAPDYPQQCCWGCAIL